MSIQTSSDIW